MPQTMAFHEIVDAAERLPAEEQETLMHLLRQRLAEQGRRRVIEDVLEGEREFKDGRARVMTVEQIMRESAP